MSDLFEILAAESEDDRKSVEYRQQALVLEIAEIVQTRIRHLGISQAELARRMGVSRQMITKLLTGDSNFQLKTLLRLGDALKMETIVDFAPEGYHLPRFYVARGMSSISAYKESGANMPKKRTRLPIANPASEMRETSPCDYTISLRA